jgi:hypothetical protein
MMARRLFRWCAAPDASSPNARNVSARTSWVCVNKEALTFGGECSIGRLQLRRALVDPTLQLVVQCSNRLFGPLAVGYIAHDTINSGWTPFITLQPGVDFNGKPAAILRNQVQFKGRWSLAGQSPLNPLVDPG